MKSDMTSSDGQILTNHPIVAFDLETSGPYPVGNEIVEFGAVKYLDGKEIDQLQLLIKPRFPMPESNIKIHGITNEMVESSPRIEEVLPQIRKFMEGSVMVAHHAPFDLGFLAHDFERLSLAPPEGWLFCTSLLARKLIPQSPNHRLQTLVKFLNIDGGQAHRGLDDARACLEVFRHCLENARLNLGLEALGGLTLEQLTKFQGSELRWQQFSLQNLEVNYRTILAALREKMNLEIEYSGGSKIGIRRITPLGIVRNPDGDFVQAICHLDGASKRFYVEKMKSVKVVPV